MCGFERRKFSREHSFLTAEDIRAKTQVVVARANEAHLEYRIHKITCKRDAAGQAAITSVVPAYDLYLDAPYEGTFCAIAQKAMDHARLEEDADRHRDESLHE